MCFLLCQCDFGIVIGRIACWELQVEATNTVNVLKFTICCESCDVFKTFPIMLHIANRCACTQSGPLQIVSIWTIIRSCLSFPAGYKSTSRCFPPLLFTRDPVTAVIFVSDSLRIPPVLAPLQSSLLSLLAPLQCWSRPWRWGQLSRLY